MNASLHPSLDQEPYTKSEQKRNYNRHHHRGTKEITRNICEKIDAKLDNLMEMDKFLITYSLPRSNHERTANQNISVMSKEIKSVITTLQRGMDTHSWTLSTP